jgi:hypothetical protein
MVYLQGRGWPRCPLLLLLLLLLLLWLLRAAFFRQVLLSAFGFVTAAADDEAGTERHILRFETHQHTGAGQQLRQERCSGLRALLSRALEGEQRLESADRHGHEAPAGPWQAQAQLAHLWRLGLPLLWQEDEVWLRLGGPGDRSDCPAYAQTSAEARRSGPGLLPLWRCVRAPKGIQRRGRRCDSFRVGQPGPGGACALHLRSSFFPTSFVSTQKRSGFAKTDSGRT